MTDQPESPILLPDQKQEQESKPGVLDGVENRLTFIFDNETGNVSYAIGKGLTPLNLINASFLLNRMANQMVSNMEMAQQREIERTSAIMRGLSKGNGGDVFRQGGDRR